VVSATQTTKISKGHEPVIYGSKVAWISWFSFGNAKPL
jgi:hypothetical protein